MGVNCDQAHGLFGCKRAEPLPHPRGRQAEAPRPAHLDGDEIAVLGITGSVGGDRQFAAKIFLVDRGEPPAAAGELAEHAQHAMLDAIDDLDGAALVADAILGVAGFLHPQ